VIKETAADISEIHEVRIRGADHIVVFSADSQDGKLTIRQEFDGRKPDSACAITLADPNELRSFFKGLRRILQSLGELVDTPREIPPQISALPNTVSSEDREAIMERARQSNPKAFAPWTREEEEDIRRRYEAGENIQMIARARKRSPRAIELRLQRLGLLQHQE
jgi:hypothetical protein